MDNKCVISQCFQGRGDCNKDPYDGCEAMFSYDSLNCGSCGNSCYAMGPNFSCMMGECVPYMP